MDLDNIVIVNNYNEVRGCTNTYNKQAFKIVSMFSSKSLVDYYIRMEWLNNSIEDKDSWDPIERFQPLYVISEKQRNQVSMATNPMNNMRE